MITKINDKYWVVSHDTHFPNWIKESGRLDHDQYVLPIIEPHLGKYGILDIGANIGTHTIYYYNKSESKKVIGFEPNPECAECLRRNVPQCLVIECAISDKDGECNMQYLDNVGASYIIEGTGLKTIKLDNHIHDLKKSIDCDKISFIKMDIEGSEVKALIGMKELILSDRPNMWIEVNRGALLRSGNSENELLNIVRNYGYKYTPYPYECIQYDILCIPN